MSGDQPFPGESKAWSDAPVSARSIVRLKSAPVSSQPRPRDLMGPRAQLIMEIRTANSVTTRSHVNYLHGKLVSFVIYFTLHGLFLPTASAQKLELVVSRLN